MTWEPARLVCVCVLAVPPQCLGAVEAKLMCGSVQGGKYAPPRDDMNAPDLYIPLMSFITFVLVTGLLKGTNNG